MCELEFGPNTRVQLITAKNGWVELLERISPDILIFGCSLTDSINLDVIKRLTQHFPKSHFVLICETLSKSQYEKLQQIRISGILSSESEAEEFLSNIKDIWFGKKIDEFIGEKIQDKKNVTKNIFTDKELNILKLVRKQLTSKEISAQLGIHIKTVEFHKSKMMEKTNSNKMIGVLEFAIANLII